MSELPDFRAGGVDYLAEKVTLIGEMDERQRTAILSQSNVYSEIKRRGEQFAHQILKKLYQEKESAVARGYLSKANSIVRAISLYVENVFGRNAPKAA